MSFIDLRAFSTREFGIGFLPVGGRRGGGLRTASLAIVE
jgi:hypothetical protein